MLCAPAACSEKPKYEEEDKYEEEKNEKKKYT